MDPKNVVSAFTRFRVKSRTGCDYEDLSPDKKRQKRGKERGEKKRGRGGGGGEEEKRKHGGTVARREADARQLRVVEGSRALILNPG